MVYARLALVALVGFPTACSLKHIRIHDDARYQESQKALELWSKVQAEPTLKIALSNLDKVAKVDLESVAISAQSNFIAHANDIPLSSWTNIRSGLDQVLNQNKQELERNQKEQQTITDNLKELLPALEAAEKALNKAQASLEPEDTPLDAKASKDVVNEVLEAAKKLRAVQMPASPGGMKDLFDSTKGVYESLERLGVILDKLKVSSHAGLQPVLQGYALDVARAARDRVEEDIRHAHALAATNGIRMAILDQAITDNEKVKNRFVKYPGQDSVLTTVQTLSKSANSARSTGSTRPDPSETELANLVDGLHRYAASFGYEKYYERVEFHRHAMEIHAHRRRADGINAREREQLISRGLQALMLFHQGGLTSQDIARLINIGELAGIIARQ